MSTQSRKRKQLLRKDSENVTADKVYDSEDLDNSDIDERKSRRSVKSKKGSQSPRKKRKLIPDEEFELEEGQEVIGVGSRLLARDWCPPDRYLTTLWIS